MKFLLYTIILLKNNKNCDKIVLLKCFVIIKREYNMYTKVSNSNQGSYRKPRNRNRLHGKRSAYKRKYNGEQQSNCATNRPDNSLYIYPPQNCLREKFENREPFIQLSKTLKNLNINGDTTGRFRFNKTALYRQMPKIKDAEIWTFAVYAEKAMANAVSKMKNADLSPFFKKDKPLYVLVLPTKGLKAQQLTLIVPLLITEEKPAELLSFWTDITKYIDNAQNLTVVAMCNVFKTCSLLRLMERVCKVDPKVSGVIKSEIQEILSSSSIGRLPNFPKSNEEYFQGDIYRGNFSQNRVGNEIYKARPVLIVSGDLFNGYHYNESVTAIPLTTQRGTFKDNKVAIKSSDVMFLKDSDHNKNFTNSFANTSQIIVLTKDNFRTKMANIISRVVNPKLMAQIIQKVKNTVASMPSQTQVLAEK